MKKILLSVMTIAIVAIAATGATGAYFSSKATVSGNSFSTGYLDIDITKGVSEIKGVKVENMQPGSTKFATFPIFNNGTLSAKKLYLSAKFKGGDPELFNNLIITVRKNARNDGEPYELVWEGLLKNLTNRDALVSQWSESGFLPGELEMITYTIKLPESAGNDLMGKITEFDFVVEGRTN